MDWYKKWEDIDTEEQELEQEQRQENEDGQLKQVSNEDDLLRVIYRYKAIATHHFRNGNYLEAAEFYSRALRYGKLRGESEGRRLAILLVNRAISRMKMATDDNEIKSSSQYYFELANLDCDKAVTIDCSYSKAFFKRAEIKMQHKRDFSGAIDDLNSAKEGFDYSQNSQLRSSINRRLSECIKEIQSQA